MSSRRTRDMLKPKIDSSLQSLTTGMICTLCITLACLMFHMQASFDGWTDSDKAGGGNGRNLWYGHVDFVGGSHQRVQWSDRDEEVSVPR